MPALTAGAAIHARYAHWGRRQPPRVSARGRKSDCHVGSASSIKELLGYTKRQHQIFVPIHLHLSQQAGVDAPTSQVHLL